MDSQRERVSVVIPVRNRESLIRRTLESVYDQTYRPITVIVVDNGSTDNTVRVVEEFRESHSAGETAGEFCIKLLREERPGAAAARNRGLREVTTRMVSFFDSDDEMYPGMLEETMRVSDGADIVRFRVERVHFSGYVEKLPFYKHRLLWRHFHNAVLATQQYIVSADFIRSAGSWEPEAMVWDDWELGIRLALNSPRVRNVESRKPLARIYLQKESITGEKYIDKCGAWENAMDIVEAKLMQSGLRGFPLRRMLGLLDYRRALLAGIYKEEGYAEVSRKLLDKTLAHTRLGAARKMLLRAVAWLRGHGVRGTYYLW
ncbi:MAG: glycosyltransferase family 2 protein [Candidatus Amulumruptor caecigallinarius]|nr:glycosyltransferase family 2 protein [Candidatus Amulumruptor caecigallinarius]